MIDATDEYLINSSSAKREHKPVPNEVILHYTAMLLDSTKSNDIPSHLRIDRNGLMFDPMHEATHYWNKIESAIPAPKECKGYVWKKEDYVMNQEYLDAKIKRSDI